MPCTGGKGNRGPPQAKVISVGAAVKVFWKDDEAWYKGRIEAFDGAKHHVAYEDGDDEWIVLADEQVQLLQPGIRYTPRGEQHSKLQVK